MLFVDLRGWKGRTTAVAVTKCVVAFHTFAYYSFLTDSSSSTGDDTPGLSGLGVGLGERLRQESKRVLRGVRESKKRHRGVLEDNTSGCGHFHHLSDDSSRRFDQVGTAESTRMRLKGTNSGSREGQRNSPVQEPLLGRGMPWVHIWCPYYFYGAGERAFRQKKLYQPVASLRSGFHCRTWRVA